MFVQARCQLYILLRVLFYIRRSSWLHSNHSSLEQHVSAADIRMNVKLERYILLPEF